MVCSWSPGQGRVQAWSAGEPSSSYLGWGSEKQEPVRGCETTEGKNHRDHRRLRERGSTGAEPAPQSIIAPDSPLIPASNLRAKTISERPHPKHK